MLGLCKTTTLLANDIDSAHECQVISSLLWALVDGGSSGEVAYMVDLSESSQLPTVDELKILSPKLRPCLIRVWKRMDFLCNKGVGSMGAPKGWWCKLRKFLQTPKCQPTSCAQGILNWEYYYTYSWRREKWLSVRVMM